MSDEEEDEPKRKKKKGKGFSKKQTTVLIAIIGVLIIGMAIQHYVIEPLYGETVEEKYARCITQKNVLDDRFVECGSALQACEFQLDQCLEVD